MQQGPHSGQQLTARHLASPARPPGCVAAAAAAALIVVSGRPREAGCQWRCQQLSAAAAGPAGQAAAGCIKAQLPAAAAADGHPAAILLHCWRRQRCLLLVLAGGAVCSCRCSCRQEPCQRQLGRLHLMPSRCPGAVRCQLQKQETWDYCLRLIKSASGTANSTVHQQDHQHQHQQCQRQPSPAP